jgi:hypothetical protein
MNWSFIYVFVVFTKVVVPLIVKSPPTVKLLDIVAVPVRDNVEPSNVKLLSPLMLPPPVAVSIRLSALFVILFDKELIADALVAKDAVPNKEPVNDPLNDPVNDVADTEVKPLIVDASAKLSLVSIVVRLLVPVPDPAKSINKLAYVICLLPDVEFPASSLIKNLSVDDKSVFVVVGNVGVAVIPVRPAPLPLNEPLKLPLKNVLEGFVVIC